MLTNSFGHMTGGSHPALPCCQHIPAPRRKTGASYAVTETFPGVFTDDAVAEKRPKEQAGRRLPRQGNGRDGNNASVITKQAGLIIPTPGKQ